MRVALSARFQAGVRALPAEQRAQVFEVMLALPDAIGKPHAHSGLGLRKLHRTGIWEARLGLGLRLVLALSEGTLTFDMVGKHEDVRRYLKEL